MTSRERVIRTLKFMQTDQVPRELWTDSGIRLFRNQELQDILETFPMDIEALAVKYKGKMTFWGEIDRQHVLQFGTPTDVRKAVQRVRKSFDDGDGGVIAQCSWGTTMPKKNIEAVFDEWEKMSPVKH